jgi:hypothetical protein
MVRFIITFYSLTLSFYCYFYHHAAIILARFGKVSFLNSLSYIVLLFELKNEKLTNHYDDNVNTVGSI